MKNALPLRSGRNGTRFVQRFARTHQVPAPSKGFSSDHPPLCDQEHSRPKVRQRFLRYVPVGSDKHPLFVPLNQNVVALPQILG